MQDKWGQRGYEDMSYIYSYQFDVASIILTITLLILFLTKMTPLNKAGRIFALMMITNTTLAACDLINTMIKANTIKAPIWAKYLFALMYLMSYSVLGILYLQYVDAKCKITGLQGVMNAFSAAMYAILGTLIISSPWSYTIVYFDKSGQYHQGPLLFVVYSLAFIFMSMEIAMIFHQRKKLNQQQVVISIVLTLLMYATVLVSIIWQGALMGSFMAAVIFTFIYISFENPAYYTYKDTKCLNSRTFFSRLQKLDNDRKLNDYDIWLIVNTNRLVLTQRYGVKHINAMGKRNAVKIQQEFKASAYSLSEGAYALIVKKDELFDRSRVLGIFVENQPDIDMSLYLINDNKQDYEDISKIIDYRITYTNEKYQNVDSNTFVDEIDQKITEDKKLLSQIKKAIENDLIRIVYQPIYDNAQQRFHSAEALLRVSDDEHGYINPEKLVIVAEEYGYIDQITDIIFEKVCKFIKDNKIKQYGIDYIEINLSPENCKQSDLGRKLMEIMVRYDISPDMINLEITETADSSGNEIVQQMIAEINESGINLSIDDFGSGFASVNYLINMPVSIVKIDKEILWAAIKNKSAMHILQSTVNMITGLGKKIVVEGVETQEMVDILTKINPEMFHQGFFYSKPIEEAQFIDFIREQSRGISREEGELTITDFTGTIDDEFPTIA